MILKEVENLRSFPRTVAGCELMSFTLLSDRESETVLEWRNHARIREGYAHAEVGPAELDVDLNRHIARVVQYRAHARFFAHLRRIRIDAYL